MLVLYLLIIVTVFVSVRVLYRPYLVERFALIPSRMRGGKEWWRVVTHMFIHGSWEHLIVNMLVFYSFGRFLLRVFHDLHTYQHVFLSGQLHFFLLYMGAGVVAGFCSCILHRNHTMYASVGASGAVSAVLFASILFDPWSLIYFFGVIPIPGVLFAILYVVYSFYMGRRGGDHIDHWAHLTGACFGLLYPLGINPSLLGYFYRQLFSLPW